MGVGQSRSTPLKIMRITIEKSKLAPVLKNVARAVSPRIPMPILTGIKFDATEDGKLVLTGTDLEIRIACTVEANVKEPGSVVLPAATIVNLIDRVPAGEVTIESEGGTATLTYGKTGKSNTKINGFSAEEFPEPPETTADVKFSINGESLCDITSRVFYAASDEMSKGCLCGVNFEIEDSNLVLAATDAYRLAIGKLALEGVTQKKTVVIPKKAIEEAGKLFRTAKEIAVQIGGNSVAFISEGMVLTSSVIAGTFPKYADVIPNSFKARIKVNPYEFIKALERVSVMLDSAHVSTVALQIKEGLIELTSQSERGNAREELEAVTNGEMQIHFNANYLINAIKNTATGDGEVSLGFPGPLKPTLVKSVSDGSIISIVLPVRVHGKEEKAVKEQEERKAS